ncbi:MAG: Transcription elongation factor GreA [Ignavibacteriae bacterium]|nr:MAG: Transcription elongation factor GreA [Ignavibacteriota bacterium]
MNNKKNDVVYLTKERIIELENELRQLKIKGRSEIAAKIAEARGYGDLSENAEYDAAKEAQEHLELKIKKIEDTLARARIIESNELPNDKIYILSKVKLKNKKNNEEVTYILVSPEEANYEENKISITSPIGKGLLGKKIGDVVQIKVPAGFLEYEILDISR